MVVAVGLVLGLWGLASADRCGGWDSASPVLLGLTRATGKLQVGVGQAPLAPRYPVTVGGYGPWRSEASDANGLLAARALLFDVDGARVAVVTVDTLLVTEPIVTAIRGTREHPVWVVAEHTHSSLGGYDARPVAQVAALGAWRADDEAAVVKAGQAALAQAEATLAPTWLEVTQGLSQGLSIARSGQEADVELTRLRFLTATGTARAQWLVVSAHPTTVDRRTTHLDADWPGRLAAEAEAQGTVTLVMQGAAGNASVDFNHGADTDGVAKRVQAAFAGLAPQAPTDQVVLGAATVRLGLPRPDGRRLVWGPFVPAMENLLCADTERDAELGVVQLGPVSFLAVPAEVAHMAGQVLRELSGATRVVSNANGYVGYLETEGAVRNGWGEAAHQYFGPELLGHLAQGARLAGSAAGVRPTR